MKHALAWLPLLAAFFLLAWQGYKEYHKVQAYGVWSRQFERAKYDIYAVLGQKGNDITWGKPTMKGPVDLATFALEDVQQIRLLIDKQAVEIGNLPIKARSIELEFSFSEPKESILVPFTEIPLAVKWCEYLHNALKNLTDSRLSTPPLTSGYD
jgi:hypothetical protein